MALGHQSITPLTLEIHSDLTGAWECLVSQEILSGRKDAAKTDNQPVG